jgi:hypothetical protein
LVLYTKVKPAKIKKIRKINRKMHGTWYKFIVACFFRLD